MASTLARGEIRPVVPGFFSLTHVSNRGAAFGLFSGTGNSLVATFLVVFSLAAVAVVLALLWRSRLERSVGVSVALILGGALGNLVDRLRTGAVVDFLDFHLGRFHWPAFNLADSAIVVGTAVLVYQLVRHHGLTHDSASVQSQERGA